MIGHSRGGHIAFRLALKRSDLIRKLILAKPGGAADPSLQAAIDGETTAAAGSRAYVKEVSDKIAAGDLAGGLRSFIAGINGPSSLDNLAAADRQMRQDNAHTH